MHDPTKANKIIYTIDIVIVCELFASIIKMVLLMPYVNL